MIFNSTRFFKIIKIGDSFIIVWLVVSHSTVENSSFSCLKVCRQNIDMISSSSIITLKFGYRIYYVGITEILSGKPFIKHSCSYPSHFIIFKIDGDNFSGINDDLKLLLHYLDNCKQCKIGKNYLQNPNKTHPLIANFLS